MRALLSVYDKEGLVELAQGLSDLGWELVASGNTSTELAEAGIAHLQVAEVTGSPEMLGGRVKTLHPKIHGGILADRDEPDHLADLEANGIDAIDLVVCNLYPFSSDPSIELIDIGGPDHGAGRGQEPRPCGHRHRAERLPRGARGAATVRVAVGGHPAPPGPGRLRPHRRLRRRHRGLARCGRTVPGRWRRRRGGSPRCRAAADAPSHPGAHGGRSATARTPTSGARGTARRGRGAGGTTSSSTAARSSPTSTSSTATRPGDWSTSWPATPGSRRWPSSSTPTRAGRRWPTAWCTAYERALECDVQSAFGGIVAIGGAVTEAVAEAIAAGPQADVIIASSYDAGRAGAADQPSARPPACCPVPPPSGRRASCAASGRACWSRMSTTSSRRARTGRS